MVDRIQSNRHVVFRIRKMRQQVLIHIRKKKLHLGNCMVRQQELHRIRKKKLLRELHL